MLKSLGKVFDKFNRQNTEDLKLGENSSCRNILEESSINLLLPEDVILIILSFLTKDDINSCSEVCQQWRSIVTGVTFWKLKCRRENRFIPPINNWTPNYTFYKNIYFKNPYSRNLIRNPCGAENMDHWEITANGGSKWVVEKEPLYCDPFNIFADTNEYFSRSCFATSFNSCAKQQLINLVKEGCDVSYIDNFQPAIEVSEWHCARGDCGSVYTVKVDLLGENITSQIESFNPESVRIEQWTGGNWSQIKHTFQNYGPGVRYVLFSHGGNDTQFWAGHYGSKMSGASVRFYFER